jgi:hypothetical protein
MTGGIAATFLGIGWCQAFGATVRAATVESPESTPNPAVGSAATEIAALDPNSPINAALVLPDCRHWFSNIACCKQ